MPTPQVIHLPLQLDTVPPLMRRGQHALILVRNQTGKFVLGSKDIYPEGIHRLIGGGIEADENPELSAARELAEELHISVPPHELQPLAIIEADITYRQEKLTFTTWLYFHQLKSDQVIQVDDDLDGVAELNIEEFEDLITRFSQLQEHFSQENNFSWQDYGALYGPIHQIALDRALDLI